MMSCIRSLIRPYFGFRNIFHALYLAVKALRHGMFDVELPIREQVAYRFVQNEEERPLVNAHTFEMRDVDKADGQRRIDPVREFFEAVVDVSRQQRGVVPFFQRQHLRDLQQAGPWLTNRLAPVFRKIFYGVVHNHV